MELIIFSLGVCVIVKFSYLEVIQCWLYICSSGDWCCKSVISLASSLWFISPFQHICIATVDFMSTLLKFFKAQFSHLQSGRPMTMKIRVNNYGVPACTRYCAECYQNHLKSVLSQWSYFTDEETGFQMLSSLSIVIQIEGGKNLELLA